MGKTATRRRPRANFTDQQKAERRARKDADKQQAIACGFLGAQAIAAHPELLDAFRMYAARVQGHRTLWNALRMFAQNPKATRVHSAFFWAKENRAVLPDAKPMCVLARRRGGKKHVEVVNEETGEVEEIEQGTWTGWTGERVFDVRDTVPRKDPCQHCGTQPGNRCPDTCQVYTPVLGPVPSREEVAELLNRILRDVGGFDLSAIDEADEDGDQ